MAFDASELSRLADRADRLTRTARRSFAGVERRTARGIAATARALAPVREGRLRAGIRAVGNLVESTDEAAPYVEYGTAYADAQPHMNPAADRHTAQFERDAEDEAVRLVERALG